MRVISSRIYHYGEIGIRGVLSNEILADKITVLSKPIMFRRAKDLVDVYALTQCVEVTTEIFDIFNKKSLQVGEFVELYTRHKDVEYAYNKLKGIDSKPRFDDVYPYLLKFSLPFAQKNKMPKIWDSRRKDWSHTE